MEVPADFTIEQAIEYLTEIWNNVGLAPESSYVQDSDAPDVECCDFGTDENGNIITAILYVNL